LLPSDDQDGAENPLKFSFASEIVELVVFSTDEAFLQTLREAVGNARRIWHVPSADKVCDLLLAGQVGILVLDVQALAEDVDVFVAQIKRQFPDLVLVVAGNSDAENSLANLISAGTVYRFIHKPMSPGRAKLFAEAAVRKYAEQRRRAPPALPGAGGGNKRLLMIAGAVLLAAGIAAWALYSAAPVHDALGSGERALILGVVIGTLVLSIGGQVWAGRSHSASGSGAGLPPGTGETYADHGVQFTYPSGRTVGPATITNSVGATKAVWTDGLSPAGASTYDVVLVGQYMLPSSVASMYPGQQEALIERLTDSLIASLGGTKTAPVAPVKVGGLQGYHVLMSVTLEGKPVAVDLNVLFLDQDEYTIVCEATDAARATIASGCSSIRDTFSVPG
jgi:hypothetical protein